jgi:hypothetical protein
VDQKRAAHGFSVFKGHGGKNVMAFFSLMILRFQKRSELKSASRIIPPQVGEMILRFQKRSELKLLSGIIPPQAEGIADTRG